jgi:hypothetical protein
MFGVGPEPPESAQELPRRFRFPDKPPAFPNPAHRQLAREFGGQITSPPDPT